MDDDKDIAATFKEFLDSYGFRSDAFNDPHLALSRFRKGKYKLAILDVRMPGMSGFELYAKLRKQDRELKICFITAFEVYYQSLRENFPGLDVKCFIRKPISSTNLYSHIIHELEGSK